MTEQVTKIKIGNIEGKEGELSHSMNLGIWMNGEMLNDCCGFSVSEDASNQGQVKVTLDFNAGVDIELNVPKGWVTKDQTVHVANWPVDLVPDELFNEVLTRECNRVINEKLQERSE